MLDRAEGEIEEYGVEECKELVKSIRGMNETYADKFDERMR